MKSFFFPMMRIARFRMNEYINDSPSAGRYVHSVRFAGPKQSVSQRQGVHPLSLIASENCINCIPGGEISTDCREEPQHARQGSHTTSKCLLGALRAAKASTGACEAHTPAAQGTAREKGSIYARKGFELVRHETSGEIYQVLPNATTVLKVGPFFVRHYCRILQRLR